MEENIRKIVAAAKESLEATERPSLREPKPSCRPRKNVAKSVAKARKNTQITAPQHQPHQQHRSQIPEKTPHPPLFRQKGA